MPTREGYDVVPLRSETKQRLAQLKGERSYDATIADLLEAAARPTPPALERPREPSEQLALADLARRRWELALARGQLEERGTRLILYRTGQKERRGFRVERA